MKLFRFGELHQEAPAVQLPNGKRLDVSAWVTDYNEAFFTNGGIETLRNRLKSEACKCPEVPPNVRIGSCIARPSKLVNIGLNYHAHAKEMELGLPIEPIFFLKATTALAGAFDPIPIPINAEKLDWEGELALVIGKKAKNITEASAMDYVAGFTIQNDLSERDFQLRRGGQWTKGKSHDGFAPLGPYLVTKEAVEDPQNLQLRLSVNGKIMQNANTSDMIFKIPMLIAYVSQFMTLLPGDVLSTGSPYGTGAGLKPPRFLQHGDCVELYIEGLGCQKQQVVQSLVCA